jgi:hypothetical protein
MRKKIAALLVAGLAATALAACGDDGGYYGGSTCPSPYRTQGYAPGGHTQPVPAKTAAKPAPRVPSLRKTRR